MTYVNIKNMFIKKLLTVLLISGYCIQLHAADMKVAKLANKCSGLFLIMTMPSDKQFKPFTQNMSTLSETMSMITAGIHELNNQSLTNGQLRDMRNREADKVIQANKVNSNTNLELYAKCDSLRENFAFIALNENDDERILNSLVMPTAVKMNEQKTFLINSILELSFQELDNAGISSIVELYKNL